MFSIIIKDLTKASEFLTKGKIDLSKGAYDSALSNFNMALSIFISIYSEGSLNINIAKCHNLIGDMYKATGLFKEAQEHYTIALGTFTHFEDGLYEIDLARIYNKLGAVLLARAENHDALINYTKAINLFFKHPESDKIEIAACFYDIAQIYENMNKIMLAMNYYTRAVTEFVKAKDSDIKIFLFNKMLLQISRYIFEFTFICISSKLL